ncbi:hypothetical protein Tsubulata_026273, partial [Turnera subulata]
CYGCFKEERDALLQIKVWINHPSGEALPSWEDGDCCRWDFVVCNTTTKRVIQLFLGSIRDWKLGDLNLNTSLFWNLKELKSLDLSRNQLSPFPELNMNHYAGWCELKNLEQLYLSGNELVGVLPPCMRNLSSLLLMDLSSNQFKGNIATSPLVDLMSLQYLTFSSNQFRVPTSFASFSNHSKLKLISCDHNELITEPNLQISSASVFQLKFLSMSNCTSETGKPDYPYFLYFQHDLRVLDLSNNNFGGQFPYWLVKNNTRLKQLYLKNNGLVRGPLQLNYPVSNLSTIDMSSNYMDDEMLKTMCSVFPNLVGLMIADNHLTDAIPRCFENMSYLAYLDMSNNKLSS